MWALEPGKVLGFGGRRHELEPGSVVLPQLPGPCSVPWSEEASPVLPQDVLGDMSIHLHSQTQIRTTCLHDNVRKRQHVL